MTTILSFRTVQAVILYLKIQKVKTRFHLQMFFKGIRKRPEMG